MIFSQFVQLYCEIWGSRMCNHARLDKYWSVLFTFNADFIGTVSLPICM